MPIPLPVIANTFRIGLHWTTAGGQSGANVFHLQATAPGHTAADCMEALDDAVTAAMWGMVASAWSVDEVHITPLDGISATNAFTPATPAHWFGGTGGDFVPAVSGVLKFTTALRGRAHRGRMFCMPPAESQISNGKFTDGTPATSATAWAAFQAALFVDADFTSNLVVASYDRKHSGAGATATVVTAIQGETTCATQRRRQERLRV